MFLTRDQLRELSGYKRKADIIPWLREKRYPIVEIDKDGWPKVPRSALDVKLAANGGGPRLRAA